MRRRAILDRRRIAQGGGLPNYVRDGLIHWYDPLSIKDPADPVWYDMAGTNHSTRARAPSGNDYHHYTWTDKGMVFEAGDTSNFSGSHGGRQQLDWSHLPALGDWTVEVVANLDEYTRLYAIGPKTGGTGVGFFFWQNIIPARHLVNVAGAAVSQRINLRPLMGELFSASAGFDEYNLQNAYVNDKETGSTYSDVVAGGAGAYLPIDMSEEYIGGSNDLTKGVLGTIHNIRIYNRHLTALEVAHNWNIDKERFDVV